MKTSAFIVSLFVVPLLGSGYAQSPVQEVIDHALIQQTSTNTQNIISMLQQQLEEAQRQSQSLNDQLAFLGDPSKVSLPVLEVIKADITRSAEAAAARMEREERIRGATGAEAFGDNAYGLVAPVDTTVTFDDGETADRDPAKYKLQGALMADLNAVEQASKEADERIVQLEDQRTALLDQLSAATDLATVLKLQTLVNTVDAQIASTKMDVTKSRQDHEILQEKLKLQTQITSQARSEALSLERQHLKSKAASSAADPSTDSGSTTTSKPFSNLTWGKKK